MAEGNAHPQHTHTHTHTHTHHGTIVWNHGIILTHLEMLWVDLA